MSDVQLYEDYPSRYSVDVSRRHRWIRGDWQLVRWLLPRVPGLGGRRRENPLSGLSRWKLFDNLRRSLVSPALALLLLLGWTALPSIWLWTSTVLGIILIPSLIACVADTLRKPGDVLWRQHVADSVRCAGRHLAQAAFTLVCLSYEAFFSLDAIARTTGRMLVTHKRLLEWNTSGDSDRQRPHGSRRLFPDYVDRTRNCRGRGYPSDTCETGSVMGSRAHYSACGSPRPSLRGGSAGHWLAAKPG